MATVNRDRLGEALNITVRRVNQLVIEGMPKVDRGRYDLGQCYFWYIRYLQKALARRENGGGPPISLQERRGKLIPIEVYEKLLIGWVVTIRQRLLALPARLASMLVGLDRRAIQETIDREIREVLLILSKDDFGDGLASVGAQDSAPDPDSGRSDVPAPVPRIGSSVTKR